MACCSGCEMLKVLNWCTLRSSRVSAGGGNAVADAQAGGVQGLAEGEHSEAAQSESGCVSTE